MMRTVALVLSLSLTVAGGALAGNPSLSAGGGGMNVLGADRDAVWSQPPNLDGLIMTSEVIGEVGLETEIVSDFYATWYNPCFARWWGGYFNNNGCGEFGVATHWNIRIYEDDNCVPGNLLWESVTVPAFEFLIYCQAGAFPIFQYESWCFFSPSSNTRYWFSAQASDHAFPPQVGRLAAASTEGCQTFFRSRFFSFPDWITTIDVFGEEVDASLEFVGYAIDGYDFPWDACCIGDEGACRTVRDSLECEAYGGEWRDDSYCYDNPCQTTPVIETTWGQLKALFR